VNNDESWRPIVDNIDSRFDAYLDAENKVNRMNIIDNRVHACVYFIQPTGHSLKPLDIEVMKRLHTKVNLIPVIAKADTLTDEEVAVFKKRVSYGYLREKDTRDEANCDIRFLPISTITTSRSSRDLAMSLTTMRQSLRITR